MLMPRFLPWLIALLCHTGVSACEAPRGQYKGKLFDAMAQIDANMAPRVEEAINNAGVEKIALFGRHKLDSHRYGGDDDVMSLVRKLPDRVIPGAPKFFADAASWDSSILRELARYLRPDSKRAFVGELLIVHGDKSHGSSTAEGERTLDVGSAAFQAVLRDAATLKIPFMLHWEVYDWSRDWPRMSALYSQWPQLIFIWPHAGFGRAEQVREVIERHPNVMVSLSKKEQAPEGLSDEKYAEIGSPMIDGCGRIEDDWKALLLDYPERFLFATDAHKDFRWAKYERVVQRWRGILKQLHGPVARKIAYHNAMRLYGLKPDPAEASAPTAEDEN